MESMLVSLETIVDFATYDDVALQMHTGTRYRLGHDCVVVTHARLPIREGSAVFIFVRSLRPEPMGT